MQSTLPPQVSYLVEAAQDVVKIRRALVANSLTRLHDCLDSIGDRLRDMHPIVMDEVAAAKAEVYVNTGYV